MAVYCKNCEYRTSTRLCWRDERKAKGNPFTGQATEHPNAHDLSANNNGDCQDYRYRSIFEAIMRVLWD